MLIVCRRNVSRWACLIGLCAFLWIDPVSAIAASRPLSSLALSTLEPRLSAPGAQGAGDADSTSTTTPFYKKTWFLAGAAGLVAVVAIVLASGGDEDEPGGPRKALPGFPPPPSLLSLRGNDSSTR